MKRWNPTPEAPAHEPVAWHTLGTGDVASRLGVDPSRGLEGEEARRRLEAQGPNRLEEEKGRPAWRMLVDQFANFLVGLLVIAAVVAIFLGERTDAVAILAILVLNAVVGFLQERKAAGAIAALRKMTAPNARVRRGGEVLEIPAEELVPGDVVVLEAGDRVPADVRLTATSEVTTVEASLTGESEPVEKDAGATAEAGAALGDRPGMSWMSTLVANGNAEGVVVATGRATEIGRIADLVRGAEDEETPLQARLRIFGRWLAAAAVGLVALVFAGGRLRGVPLMEMLLTSISLAVAAVPEGLPAVVTLALALGVHRLARRRALVRRLASVETLGSTSVICTDKTGTLTVGKMSARKFLPSSGQDPRDLLYAAAAASTARFASDGSVTGDPTEAALIMAAHEAGIDVSEEVTSSRPFDSQRKRMSITRGAVTYVKGAPEAVLTQCVNELGEGGTEKPLSAEWGKRAEDLAGEGMRVLAVARREAGGADPEEKLTLLGLVGLHDPPREEAKAAVETCMKAGIRVVMITGDHPRTALAIAKALGIASNPEEVMTGTELEKLPEAELAARVPQVLVYARVSPEHKLRIIRAWQSRGDVVAMTGDGVNDAPALKAANIGVAMGKTGTDVAREASDIVIADDNFATIVSAVREGRRIFENIRKTVLYLLTGNLAEILLFGIAIIAGLPLPLVAIQLLWVNLVTDGLPALALATDPADRDVLAQPPRRAGSEIADREFLVWLGTGAALAAACTFGVFAWALGHSTVEKARTLVFSVLVVEEVLRAFAYRSRTRTLWEVGALSNARLAMAAAMIIGLQIATHHVGFLGKFLQTGPLTWGECLLALGIGFIPVSLLETWKILRRLVRR